MPFRCAARASMVWRAVAARLGRLRLCGGSARRSSRPQPGRDGLKVEHMRGGVETGVAQAARSLARTPAALLWPRTGRTPFGYARARQISGNRRRIGLPFRPQQCGEAMRVSRYRAPRDGPGVQRARRRPFDEFTPDIEQTPIMHTPCGQLVSAECKPTVPGSRCNWRLAASERPSVLWWTGRAAARSCVRVLCLPETVW